MQPTQTGIAVALALVVVAVFFLFPGLSPLGGNVAGTATEAERIANPTMGTDQTGELQITDTVVGTGATAEAGDVVTVQYVGTLENGTVFDASANHGTAGFTFPLGAGQVIPGWDNGLIGMKEGGKRRLVIPPALAYGDQAIADIIPANSTLIFEVEMVKVQKAGQ